MENILEIKNLKKNYHTLESEIEALKDISFTLKPGEFISIVGPSGCGKSTILSILSNLIKPSSGTINKNDNCIVSYMLQDDYLLPFRNILNNCLLGLEVKKTITKENVEYVKKLLKTYGLEKFIDKYPDNLSGGMKQRVALIRTLAINPDILLLDEATSALDYQTRLAISEDIYNIIKKEGKTAIMVTHDIAQAITMSDRIIVLTKRPSTIKNIYHINFDKNISFKEKRNTKKFNDYYDKIWSDLDDQL